MNILKAFSKEERELLKNINLIIEDKEYEEIEIKQLAQNIYNNGFMNMNITYAEAEKYRQIYEQFEYIDKVDIDKVKKYTKKEFDDDYYLCTIMMHGILWNNPNRINEMRKGRNEKTLTKEEYQKYEKKSKENSKELANYMKYLEEKYGGKLSMIEKYYNTISR